MTPEDPWARWCRWFDRNERELYGAMHARWMWNVLSDVIDTSGVPKHPTLMNYLSHTYVVTACAFVRRQASDNAKHDAGMVRCLRLLIRHKEIATRALFVERGDAHHDLGWNDSDGFRHFAPGGGETIEEQVILADIEQIVIAAGSIKGYADTTIAHTGPAELPASNPVTMRDIDAALGAIESIVLKYFSLRNPGTMLISATPVADATFMRMLQRPWFPPGSVAPPSLSPRPEPLLTHPSQR